MNRRTEDGSISLWVAVTALSLMLIIGIAVDLGGQVQTQQRARDVAAQAARVAGQQISGSEAIQGDSISIDVAGAVAAAEQYLHSSGMDGTVTIAGGTHVLVQVTATYQTKVLGIIGIGSTTVTGESTARIVRVSEGIEQ